MQARFGSIPLGRPAPYSDPPDKGQERPLRQSHPRPAWEKSRRLGYKSAAMTPTTIAAAPDAARDFRVISLVSSAHFVSHYYNLVLPPLFPLVRAEFGVSYVELGAALIAFNVVSGTLQIPAGFLVDRISVRAVLVGALAVGAAALAIASMASAFWLFVASFALLGLANTVYHPADYALLSHRVSVPRMPTAYSVHTFAGILGSALAPGTLLFLAATFGWRGAFLGAAVLGFCVAALMLATGDVLAERNAPPERIKPSHSGLEGRADWRVLLTPAILVNFVFFMLLSLANGGVQNYSVVALGALRGTELVVANMALTSYLVMSAIGVLLGGYAALRTTRHDGIAMLALAANALAVLGIAFLDLGSVPLVLMMAAAGLLQGMALPSRDMLVRAVTPPGAFGRVFGFVTTGFNLAGMAAPLMFGWLMDQGHPEAIFLLSAGFGLATILTVMIGMAQRYRS
jgi:FSR family fosmidomycin resistance protein-like MFS transporter